jgi:hypothetical protein
MAVLAALVPVVSGAGSVFGLGSQLNTVAACVSLICIVLFTIAFEVFQHKLDHNLEGSVYQEMVQKIYSELTILGIISFMVFLFLQSEAKNDVDMDIIIAFEFSHIVIFFAALIFVLEAFFMMLVNQRLKQRIDKASAMTSKDLLEVYNKDKAKIDASSQWVANEFCTNMEYKVLNIFFCEQYRLPLSIFDFPAYIREVLDHNILSLIEVDISSWLALCLLLLVNVIRSEIAKLVSSDADDADEAHRMLMDMFNSNAEPIDAVHRLLGTTATVDETSDCPTAGEDVCAAVHLDGYEATCTGAGNGHECEYTAADDSHEEACAYIDGSSRYLAAYSTTTTSSSYAENSTHYYLRILGSTETDTSDECDSCDAERRLGAEVYRFLGAAAAVDAETCDPCALSRRLGGDSASATAEVCACVTEVHRRLGGDAACDTCAASADGEHRMLAASACIDPCAIVKKSDGLIGFIAGGWILLFIVMVLAYLSRRAEKRLFSLIGLNSWADQAAYIEKSEKLLQEREAQILAQSESFQAEQAKLDQLASENSGSGNEKPRLERRQTRQSFEKEAMLKAMKEQTTEGGGHGGHDHGHEHHDAGLTAMKGATKAIASKVGVTGALDMVKGKLGGSTPVAPAKGLLGAASRRASFKSETPINLTGEGEDASVAAAGKKYLSASAQIHPGGEEPPADDKERRASHSKHHHGDGDDEDAYSARENELAEAEKEFFKTQDDNKKSLSARRGIDLSSVYMFKSPLLFYKTLDICLLLNCFYLAVFFSNYLIVALDYGGTEGAILALLCLIPAVAFYPFVVIVTRTSSVLSAIATLDAKIVGHVIDETEDMLNIQHEVFDLFRQKMEEMGLDHKDLKELFSEIDVDHSGEVDAKELQCGLGMLGMHFSATKFKRLFRAVDKDRSGAINFEEFFHLVYPDLQVEE